MRIGFDLRPLQTAHRGAGIGTYTFNLARHLAALDTSDRWVYLALKDIPISGLETTASYAVRRPRKSSHTAFWEQLLLPIDLIRCRLDLFHATGGLTQVWEIGAPYVQPCKMVITVQDLHPFIIPDFRFIADARVFKWQMKALRKAAGIISVSNNTKQDLMRFLDLPSERIDVIPMAAGEHFRVLDNESTKNALRGFDLPDPYVLYVGNYNTHKNIEALIDAWLLLPRTVHLALVGHKETYPASILERVSLGRREETVHFIGGLSHYSPELVALYNRAAVFVFPSLYEGFGLPVLEAMQCGCPVVASRRGSLPEVVGDAGVLVEPQAIDELADAIRRILDDVQWREQLRTRGFENAKQYSWEQTAQKTLELYHRVA